MAKPQTSGWERVEMLGVGFSIPGAQDGEVPWAVGHPHIPPRTADGSQPA